MSHVLIYLHIVFMPCTWYANHALRVNITDTFLFVWFLILAGRRWRKWGRKNWR